MSLVKAAAVGGGVLAVLAFVALGVFLPVAIVGAIVSAVFGLGFWLSCGYVALARIALLFLVG